MSVTGLDVFDTTVDKTNGGLKDLMERLQCSRHDAYVRLAGLATEGGVRTVWRA